MKIWTEKLCECRKNIVGSLIKDIAKVLFVVEGTIRNRVQKMSESGMSKIIDFTDPMDIK